jgi:Tfp pilus assembly PilM family ATPase
MLNATDGADYDLAKANQKEVIFCGVPNEDITSTQESLLKMGVFPERLELGTVATLGALVDCLAFEKSKTPTLVLDVGNDTTHSFIVSAAGVEASRPIPQGLEAMVPVVQKELGLKDEESARKLFRSNTFDFTGMGPLLIKRLLKELQSSIGFYEVQTGQSVGQVICIQLSPKLAWLEGALASSLGIAALKFDPLPWLKSRNVTVPDTLSKTAGDFRWFGLMSLMVQYNSHNGGTIDEKK